MQQKCPKEHVATNIMKHACNNIRPGFCHGRPLAQRASGPVLTSAADPSTRQHRRVCTLLPCVLSQTWRRSHIPVLTPMESILDTSPACPWNR